MQISYSRIFLLVALFSVFSTICANGQSKLSCADIKTGQFYFYAKNSTTRYRDVRDDKYVYEYDLDKGDSSVWKLDWLDDCTYSMKHVSGNAAMTPEMKDFVKKHPVVCRIENITEDYYTFKSYIDKPKGNAVLTDTMWLHEKVHFGDNLLFEQIPGRQAFRKARFSDTSKYAAVYIYRPGKFSNSWGDYILYMDDVPMCLMKNNTGYMFKLLKEGDHIFTSRLDKDSAAITFKTEVGKSYYLKPSIKWGFYKFKNYKLEMFLKKPEDGKIEFEEVNF